MQQSVNKVAGILLLLVLICVGSTVLTARVRFVPGGPGAQTTGEGGSAARGEFADPFEANFVKPNNVQNVVRYSAQYGIIGIGVAFVIITGGIDLSIGSVIGLIGCLLPMFLVKWGWSVPASLSAVMLVSLLIGLAHGLLITKMRLQPFIVTLCGLLIYRGLARWITADQTMGFGNRFDDSLRLLAIGEPCSVAFLLLLAGLGLLLWSLVRGWQWVRGGERSRDGQVPLVVVSALIGIMLGGIGGSRFLYGYAIESGHTLLSLGPIDIPSWGTRVTERGQARPGELMALAKYGVVPGVLWLLATLAISPRRERDGSRLSLVGMLPPLVTIGLASLCVWGAVLLVKRPDADFLGGASWARMWRIVCVFTSLGVLIASLGWFGRRALRLAGNRAVPPLLFTSMCVILWMLGFTPLGNTLVPAPMIVLLVLAGVASVFLNQTIYGRYLLALGNNEEAARFSGIQTDRMILLAYVLCSLTAGLGGILFALDTNTIQPQSHGNFYELYAIAAAVLGGCSLRGGEGTILGVVIGAAVMRVLYNSINLIGIPSQLEFAIIGTVILLGVLADEVVKRVMARGRSGES